MPTDLLQKAVKPVVFADFAVLPVVLVPQFAVLPGVLMQNVAVLPGDFAAVQLMQWVVEDLAEVSVETAVHPEQLTAPS